MILYDAAYDPRAAADRLTQYGIRNAVSVPLIVEKRDDDKPRPGPGRRSASCTSSTSATGSDSTMKTCVCSSRWRAKGAAVIAQAQLYREVVQEKQELIHTIDSLYAGLLMVGTNGRVVQINPSARAILGIPINAALIGQAYREVIPDERVASLLERALAGNTTEVADEITVPVRDISPEDELRERIYQIQCAPVP